MLFAGDVHLHGSMPSPLRFGVLGRFAQNSCHSQHIAFFTPSKNTSAKLCPSFVSVASHRLDDRVEEVNWSYPDLRKKRTKDSLWIAGALRPPRVETGLLAMARGSVQPDLHSWNKLLAGHNEKGQHEQTIQLFQQLQREGVSPNAFTFVSILHACATLRALEEGRRIHSEIMKSGFGSDVLLGNSLVDMYSKCRSIEDAWRVFTKMPTRNVVSWTVMIVGYVKCGHGDKALDLCGQMQLEGVRPDRVAFLGMLYACASVGALEEGRRVHEQICQSSFESDIVVANSIVDMYSKCGSIDDARRVFNKMPKRDVVTWSAMLAGYVKCGQGAKALKLARQMHREEVYPDRVAFIALLNACASVAALEEGRKIHKQIIQRGYETDAFVANSLVDMYAKCGNLQDAQMMFDRMPAHDVVAWNALILGFVKSGEGMKALELFRQMHSEGVSANPATFVELLNACASVGALEEGRHIHEKIIQGGFESDVFIASSLVDMYAKCGSIDEAKEAFDKMPARDAVAWSALIVGYVKCGRGQKALELSRQMQLEGIQPDHILFVGMVNACASVAALEEGRHVHTQIIQSGYETNVFVANSLIDMYAKCGSVEDAWKVFNKMLTRDVVAWNAMLAAYARHGHAKEALEHWKRMWEEGIEMDGITFVSLLSSCSHGGFIDEGLHFFGSMVADHDISPTPEHHGCVVDLLGRAGRVHEAEDLIKTMPCKQNVDVWRSLLGACRIAGNVDMAECIGREVLTLNPEDTAVYVMLSNIYCAVGKWDSSAHINRERFERHVKD